jgi:sporulation protein YlmC with PRC-barrel domain
MTQHTNHYTLTVREVAGKSVKNPNEEVLGKVKDVLLDTINGTVATVVMVSGGLFGIGEKQLAVPWDMLHYEEDSDALIMNIDKDFLQRIPAYTGEEEHIIS